MVDASVAKRYGHSRQVGSSKTPCWGMIRPSPPPPPHPKLSPLLSICVLPCGEGEIQHTWCHWGPPLPLPHAVFGGAEFRVQHVEDRLRMQSKESPCYLQNGVSSWAPLFHSLSKWSFVPPFPSSLPPSLDSIDIMEVLSSKSVTRTELLQKLGWVDLSFNSHWAVNLEVFSMSLWSGLGF